MSRNKNSRNTEGLIGAGQEGRAPGVVVAAVEADGIIVAGLGAVKVLVGKVLVAAEREGVGEGRVQLQRALEESQRSLVLLS